MTTTPDPAQREAVARLSDAASTDKPSIEVATSDLRTILALLSASAPSAPSVDGGAK